MVRAFIAALVPALALACLPSVAAAQPGSGVQVTPDGAQILVTRDIGPERWAISRNVGDETITGNVFHADGSPPQFVWCEPTGGVSVSCSGADACVSSPCRATSWSFIAEVTLPPDFFAPPPPRAAGSLNVVLLFADDLGYSDLETWGGTAVPSPNIDSLSAQGMSFTSAYVTAGTCGPSRAALLTGRYQQRFGFEFNTGARALTHAEGRGLDPSATMLQEVLRDAGYATGMMGKWHLGSQDVFHPLQRGFDEFYGFLQGAHPYFAEASLEGREDWETLQRDGERVTEPEYLTDALAREAVEFIRRHREEPFFLYVPFNAVHTPIEASERYLDRFADVADPETRAYRAMTSALDEAVGTILGALEAEGVADDTLVIFTNDNGGVRSRADNGPWRLGKSFLFEGGIRVPLIVRWPGVAAPDTASDDVVSLLDLFPTILGAAGVATPSGLGLDGADLGAHLRGTASAPAHEALFWRNGPNKAVRAGAWKLIQAGDHTWLFGLDADPGETTNLADDRPDVVGDLRTALGVWEEGLVAPAWPSRNERTVTVDGVEYEIHI